jgi:hypothetical protein
VILKPGLFSQRSLNVERWLRTVPVTAVALLASAAVHANAQRKIPNPCTSGPGSAALLASTNRLGLIDLHFANAQGAVVTYFECVDGQAKRLGERVLSDHEMTGMSPATWWRCGRLTRNFAATTTLPGGERVHGTTNVRTRSCAHRFRLDLPRQLAPGRWARVRVVDRWRIGGVRARMCIVSPRGHRACSSLPLITAEVVTRRFRVTMAGRWHVELRVPRQRIRATVAVGVPRGSSKAALPTVLATGDSMMQGVESFLSDELRGLATVVSDVRPGLPISGSNRWAPIAASQAARLQASTTVVSIGGSEGLSMRTPAGQQHGCCDEPWVAEYARRVRRMMLSYGRRGRIVWLTIPAPRDPRRVPIVDAVNAAIVRASHGLDRVRILRIDLLFSPRGYRANMRYRGRTVRVRAPDGVHLNVTGTKIAARAVAQHVRNPRRALIAR